MDLDSSENEFESSQPILEPPQRSSELQTVLTISLNIAGGGLLVLPLAMHEASVVTGTVLLVLCAAASTFTGNLLVLGCVMTDSGSYPEAFSRIILGPDTDSMTERDAAKKLTLRRRISSAVDVMVAGYTMSILVLYVCVVADMCVDTAAAFTTDSQWLGRTRYFGAAFCLFFAMSCKRQMSELAASTVLGILTIVYTMTAMVIEYSFFTVREGRLAHAGVEWMRLDKSVNVALPVITVAVGYHYNAPSMYREMEDTTPRKFHRNIIAATTMCATLYVLFGTIGYFTFGPEVDSDLSGGNVMNLYPTNSRLIAIARIALAAHIVCVFPVIAIGVRDAVHRLSLRIAGEHEMAEDGRVMLGAHRSTLVLESALVCGTAVVIAINLEQIGFIVDVTGVLFGIFLVFIGPGMMGLAINGGLWRHSRAAQERLEAVDAFTEPCPLREMLSLAIAAVGGVALILGLLSVIGL